MKRLVLIFILLLTLTSVSCKRSANDITAAQLIGNSFSCNVSFFVAGTEFRSVLTKSDGLALKLLTPETVEGFLFEKQDTTVTVSYNGIGLSVDTEKLPAASVSYNLFEYYSADLEGFTTDAREDGIYLYKDIAGTNVYTVFDKVTLIPLRTFDESGNFEVTYSDYRLLENKNAP